MPYDGAFMETFYLAWETVQQFLAADTQVPAEVNLPRPAERQVARYLADRREFEVVAVTDALVPLSQPELLRTDEAMATLIITGGGTEIETSSVIAPNPVLSKVGDHYDCQCMPM